MRWSTSTSTNATHVKEERPNDQYTNTPTQHVSWCTNIPTDEQSNVGSHCETRDIISATRKFTQSIYKRAYSPFIHRSHRSSIGRSLPIIQPKASRWSRRRSVALTDVWEPVEVDPLEINLIEKFKILDRE